MSSSARSPFVRVPLALCLALASAAAHPAGAEGPDLATLLRTARTTLEEDLATWGSFVFERRVLRERLGRSGEVTARITYRFEVRPTGDGFDERLLSIDGERPSRREIERHRRLGRFEKHYRVALSAELDNPFGEDLPLVPLLFDQEHRYVGLEEIAGAPCHRLAFDPRPDREEAPTAERLQRAARGSLCLSADGGHVLEAEMESVRPVAQGRLGLNRLALRFKTTPVEGAWLPRMFEVHSDVKLGIGRMEKRNRYEYTGYRRP